MRIINVSVDGIQQAVERGLYQWLEQQDADIICLQDCRMPAYLLEEPPYLLDGYFCYFFDSGIDNAYGVGIFTKAQPKALIYGLGFSNGVDMQGRYIQADFDRLSVGSLLAPQSDGSAENAEIKTRFFDDLQAHLHKITRKRRDFIFCGNWAMAHTKNDVQNPAQHQDTPGFQTHERLWMDQLYSELGYTDAFRQVNKDNDEFTFWPSGEAGKGDGWRTDFQVVSESLRNKVEYATVYKNQVFSSHMPVTIDYDIELPEMY